MTEIFKKITCTCKNNDISESLFGNGNVAKALSPDPFDLKVGIVLMIIFHLIILFLLPVLLIVIIPVECVLLVLLLIGRLLKRHSITCSARWAFIVYFGVIGRFFSFGM